MNRQEFSKPIAREIVTRASIKGVPTCEFVDDLGMRCGCTKGLELAHVQLDAMKSDEAKRSTKLTAQDGLLLCKPHHKAYDAPFKADFAKANHIRDRALGVDKPKKGFARVSKTKEPLRVANGVGPGLMRRGFVPAGDNQ